MVPISDVFIVSLSRGSDFRIGNPYHSRKKNEPVSIEIPLVIPSNCGLKIFSVDAGFQTYIVNDGKEFINLGDDYEKATAITHSLF